MKARITSRLTRGRNTGSKHRWARGATDGNRRENPRLGITNCAKEGGRIILQNKTGNNPNTQHEVDTFNQMKKDTWKERKKGNRPNGKLWRGNIQPAAVKYNQIDKKKKSNKPHIQLILRGQYLILVLTINMKLLFRKLDSLNVCVTCCIWLLVSKTA